MSVAVVDVVCSDPSHPAKVAKVARWFVMLDAGPEHQAVGGGDPRTKDDVVLVNERPHTIKEVFGGARGGPSDPPSGEIRHREALTCPLCGLRVEMRAERAREVRYRLGHAGVSTVTLSALAATL